MYKKLLYNQDCILDIKTNKVIFDGFNTYSEYIKWKVENPREEVALEDKKQALLRWNLGASHDEVKEDGTVVSKFYFPSGFMHKKEIKKPDGTTDTTLFNKRSQVLSRSYKEGEKEVEESFDPLGRVIEKTTYINGNLESIYNTDYLSKYQSVTTKGNVTYFCKYYDEGLKYKFIEKDYRSNYCLFTEFYIEGNIRGKGKLNAQGEMHGIWKYYHQNGELASLHKFNNGKLVKKSTLYYEDGSLNFEVYHD